MALYGWHNSEKFNNKMEKIIDKQFGILILLKVVSGLNFFKLRCIHVCM